MATRRQNAEKRGYWNSPESRIKNSNTKKGVLPSEETKKKLKEARKGREYSKSWWTNLRASIKRGEENHNHGRLGELSGHHTIILNIETGIFYFGAPEAAKFNNIDLKKLRGMFYRRKNTTSLIQV